MFKNYSEELASSLAALTGKKKEEIQKVLMDVAEQMYETGEIGGEDGEPVVDKSTEPKKGRKKKGDEEMEEDVDENADVEEKEE
jgi:hypothetical protein